MLDSILNLLGIVKTSEKQLKGQYEPMLFALCPNLNFPAIYVFLTGKRGNEFLLNFNCEKNSSMYFLKSVKTYCHGFLVTSVPYGNQN